MAGKNAKWGEQLIKNGNLEIQGDAGNAKWTGLIVKNTATHPNGETAHGVEISMQMQAYEAGTRDYRPAARIVAIKGTGNDWYTGGASTNFQGQMYFQTRQNDVMQTGLQIDNGGRVTMPYQPAFQAYNPQGQYVIGVTEAAFNSAYSNVGGHYDTSTGRFTAPVSGNYFFHFDALIDGITGGQHFSLRKNGIEYNGSEAYHNGTEFNVAKAMVYYLAASDYVSVFLDTANSRIHQRYGSFCGYLIG